jgi:hypothetical protein
MRPVLEKAQKLHLVTTGGPAAPPRFGPAAPIRLEHREKRVIPKTPLPTGIFREPGRGFRVEIRIRPLGLRRRRFPRGTPIDAMLAWRAAQQAEMLAHRAAGTVPIPDTAKARAARIRRLDLVALLDRAAGALERIATVLEQGVRR